MVPCRRHLEKIMSGKKALSIKWGASRKMKSTFTPGKSKWSRGTLIRFVAARGPDPVLLVIARQSQDAGAAMRMAARLAQGHPPAGVMAVFWMGTTPKRPKQSAGLCNRSLRVTKRGDTWALPRAQPSTTVLTPKWPRRHRTSLVYQSKFTTPEEQAIL